MTKRKNISAALALTFFLIIWSGFIYFFGAQEIVNFFGARNSYLIMFLVSLFGGVSSFGGPSYFATLLTLAAGGLNPLYLALASGLGVSIGDSVYFYIGKHGLGEMVHGKIRSFIERVDAWLNQKPSWLTYFSVYLYTGFTPLPNDILTIVLGLTNRKYVPSIIALTLGNITLTFLVAQFGRSLPFL